jgi:hypothetical protein
MTRQTKTAPARGRWACPHRVFQPENPRPHRRDCQGQLLAALEALIAPAGTIGEASLRPWCSATFIGAQHRIALRLRGEGAAQQAAMLSAKLPEMEFALRGHVVADLSIDAVATASDGDVTISLAVLTIEDW